MFGLPSKQAVTLTPSAVKQIIHLMENSGKEGLRIGVKKGGCAGMEYTMDFADSIDEHDEVIEQNGAKVIIAPMAQMFLFGTQIDFQTTVLETGFKFTNPNVVESCGCGESIRFKDL
ncbi:MAG: iron-sulfur cluster assembly accessory protein [Rhodobacteraceae bacterium]|nr:iron-sulfur cluster assembly accessory protein [Paracoccaceae bacterium]